MSHLCLKRMVSQSQLLESLTHEEALITLAEDMIVGLVRAGYNLGSLRHSVMQLPL